MGYLLDTNIISNITKSSPSASLLAWMAEQPEEDLHISSLTVAEIQRGILEKPAGKRRRELEPGSRATRVHRRCSPGASCPSMTGRPVWARLMADGKAKGRPRSALDMIVAAVAVANDCLVVTDDERDFAGIEIFNPMRSQG